MFRILFWLFSRVNSKLTNQRSSFCLCFDCNWEFDGIFQIYFLMFTILNVILILWCWSWQVSINMSGSDHSASGGCWVLPFAANGQMQGSGGTYTTRGMHWVATQAFIASATSSADATGGWQSLLLKAQLVSGDVLTVIPRQTLLNTRVFTILLL